MICKVSFGIILDTCREDKDGMFIVRLHEFDSKHIKEVVNLFKKDYHELVETLLTEFFFGDYNRLRHSLELTESVTVAVHQWNTGPEVILRVFCPSTCINNLLQVFADKELRDEITRRAFEYV